MRQISEPFDDTRGEGVTRHVSFFISAVTMLRICRIMGRQRKVPISVAKGLGWEIMGTEDVGHCPNNTI